MSFLAILETLNFEFLVNLGLESCSNLLKSNFRTSKIAKNDVFGPFEITKFDFTKIRSGCRIIKFRQSQAITSHFESYWSIVNVKKISKVDTSEITETREKQKK